nr:glucose-6-phosphate isomerase family protein [Sulfobacillus harzensis]
MVARHYSAVSRHADRRLWEQLGLQYGILELAAGLLGREWVTFPAHLHLGPRRTPFAAIIEIMQGSAWVLLQKVDSFDRLHTAARLRLEAGERAILPPGHIHAVMNVGSIPLVVAEAHAADTIGDFESVARHRGAGYYGSPEGLRPNPHYRAHPRVKELSNAVMAPPDTGGRDLYRALLEWPERFRFLHPY